MAASTIFQDEIFTATDLNRHAGKVLDEAKNRPVTIMRNDEAFALLPRKEATRLVEAASNGTRMVDILTAISTYRQAGAQIPVGYPCEWLNAFDMEELMDFLKEAHLAFRRAMGAEISWDDFEAVLYEWHESAIALRSEALAAAFAAPGDEVPLTRPVLTPECGADA
jgi:hypothetical protein